MNRGFTLMEVLGAIIILSLTALIAVPAINTLTKDSKQKSYEKQIDTIIDSTKDWTIKNAQTLPEHNISTYIDLNTLKEEGFLPNEEIINPKNREEMTGCVEVKYKEDFNQYVYNYFEVCPN